MIVDWIIGLGSGIVTWIAGLFPKLPLPAFVTDSLNTLYAFMNTASGIGNWIPWAAIGTIVGIVVTWFLAVFGIKLILLIWRLIPVVGGG